jgi:hypothetical protein
MKPIAKCDPLADPLTTFKELRASFTLDSIVAKPSQCQINKEVFEHDGDIVDAYWIDYPAKKFNRDSDNLLIVSRLICYEKKTNFYYNFIGYSGIECHLSRLFNLTILHLEYRLCPEHSHPAAVEDTVAVYRALLHQSISPSQLLIMGDSAGGGLSLLTIQALIAHKLPVPRGVIVLSPWVDLTSSGESYSRNAAIDVMLNTDDTKWIASKLLGPNHSQHSLNNPLISPLFGSFEGFPPMYVTVGTAEILEDDSREIVKKAEKAGVDVTFEEGLHLAHVYPLFFSYYPEAQNTIDNIHKWIQRVFAEKDNQ